MKSFQQMSHEAQMKFQLVLWLVTSANQQQRIFRTAFTAEERERLFTPEQRRGLNGLLEDLDLIGLDVNLRRKWQEHTRHSVPRTDLELAHRSGLIDVSTYRWLMEELEEEVTETVSQLTPRWTPETGELQFQGQVIRRVRRQAVAKNVISILEEFEAEGWPHRIDNPLTDKDSEKLRDTIASLNQGLTKIRFEADGTGTGVRWKLKPSKRSARPR